MVQMAIGLMPSETVMEVDYMRVLALLVYAAKMNMKEDLKSEFSIQLFQRETEFKFQ